jgi:hypothetical protein
MGGLWVVYGLPVFQTIYAARDIALPRGLSVWKNPVAVPVEPIIEVVNFVLLHSVYRFRYRYRFSSSASSAAKMAAKSMAHPPTGCRASRQGHAVRNTGTPSPPGGTMHIYALDGVSCR